MLATGVGSGSLLQAEVLEETTGARRLLAKSPLSLVGLQPETKCFESFHDQNILGL
jgi:hypothetical protein